jgi:hypothetical protein
MSITVRCQCGKRIVFKDEQAGKRGKCPACKESFLIQDENSVANVEVVEEVEEAPEIEEVDDEEEVAEPRKKRPKHKKTRKRREPIRLNTSGFTLFGLFGDTRIFGCTPGCLLIGIAILVGGGLTVYFTVPGVGSALCYKATEMRDEMLSASYEVQVTIFNTPEGNMVETVSTGRIIGMDKGKKIVASREHVVHRVQGKDCTIEWSEDRGVYSVKYNGKEVPRSIFSTSGASR